MSDSCAAGEFLTFSTPLSDLLPDHVFMSWDCVDRCSEPLHAQENEFIRTAVEKRRREYTAGRASARRALNALGVGNYTLLSGDKRQPLWPEGVSGSITHDGNYAVTVVAMADRLPLLGIDLARADPLKRDLIRMICTEDDREHIASLGETRFPYDPYKAIFSVKESVYKCLFPRVNRFFGFQEVNTRVYPDGVDVDVVIVNKDLLSDADCTVSARIAFQEEYLFSVAWVNPE